MNCEYQETGGLRWGDSIMTAANVTWPFAKLTLTPETIHISTRFIMRRHFDFRKRDIIAIRQHRSAFSTGILITHNKADCARVIVFWTSGYQRLKAELNRLGYTISDEQEQGGQQAG